MKTKRKIPSLLLALCIVLTFVPTLALAAPADAVTIYLSGTGGSDSADGTAPEKAVKTLDKAKELAGEGGTIVITGGLVLKDAGSIDLSGVTIQRGENYANTLFILQGNTTMTLSNVTLDGRNIETRYNLILVEDGAELNIGEGAKLCNNAATALKVYASKGSSATVNMTGGEISGNTDSRGNNAGGVAVGNYGIFNMSGGTIRENYTNSDGGGVQVAGNGKFYMSGGFIEENWCAYDGGGIGNYGYVEITGGEVRNNSARYGGGLAAFYDNTGTILDGGSITGNEAVANDEASGNGGGVFLNNPSVFTMKSGSITDNKADGWGGGIYSWEDAEWGTAIIRIQGGTISGNTVGENKLGDAVAVSGDSSNGEDTARLELSGSPTISGTVVMDDTALETTKVAVVGSFTPVKPVTLDDFLWNNNRVFVTYAEGLVPNASDFQFADEKWGALVEGQNIVRVEMHIVDIWVEATEEYQYFFTLPGNPIDQSKIPAEAVTKTGYSVSGWERRRAGSSLGLWDMQAPVNEDLLLHPVWKLNPATVTLTAAKDKVHVVNDKTVLTVETSHVVPGVSYSWKWYKDDVLIAEGNDKKQLEITEAGTYTVEVTANDGKGLSDPAVQSIAITQEGHSLTKTEAVAATHLTDGNIAYWYCDGCGKYYSDEAAETEITLAQTVTPKTPDHTADDTGWHSDGENHWNTCECGEELNKAAHAPEADDDDCTTPVLCSVCDATVTEAQEHDFSGEWQKDENGHWHTCQNEGCTVAGTAAAHAFEWIIDKVATETEKGEKHEACSVCGYAKEAVEIPATGTTAPSDPATPETGDNSKFALWFALITLSGAAAALTVRRNKGKN